MKKIVISFIIVNALISCNFLSPIDSSIQTHNVEYSEKDIIGTWRLDRFSYEYLSKKENLDSIYITFKADSTFVLNNSIDLFDRIDYNDNEKINGRIDNLKTEGKWKITHYETLNHKDFILKFDDNETRTDFKVYKKGDEYQIWFFFNDPDTGQRLRFLKNH